MAIFGEFLSDQFPDITTIGGIEWRQIQTFLTWTATASAATISARTVGPFVTAHAVIVLCGFFDDITEWDWPQALTRRLMFTGNIPKQPKMAPRALAPDTATATASSADQPLPSGSLVRPHASTRRAAGLPSRDDRELRFGRRRPMKTCLPKR